MKSKLGALKKRIGFLPLWAWLTLGGTLLYVWRRRTSSTSTPAGSSTTGAVDASGSSNSNGGGFGAGDGSGGLPLDQPTQQATADQTLSQTGAPAVFDPVGSSPNATGTGDGATLNPGGDNGKGDIGASGGDTGVTKTGVPFTLDFVRNRDANRRHGSGHPTDAHPTSRPTKSRGTRSAKPRARVQSHTAPPAAAAHPTSKASQPPPSPVAQTHTPAAVTRDRSSGAGAATTKPNAGARTTVIQGSHGLTGEPKGPPAKPAPKPAPLPYRGRH